MRTLSAVAFALALALMAALGSGSARADFVFAFDEDGRNVFFNTNNPSQGFSRPSSNATDPFDPNNGLKPLIYNLGSNFAMTVGDIELKEAGSNDVQDLLRWTTKAVGNTTQNLLVIYSDIETGDSAKADVGIPTARQQLMTTMDEMTMGLSDGLFGYKPGAGQIGNVPNAPTTYNFSSDGPLVPEPSSAALMTLGCGCVGVFLGRRGRLRWAA